MRGFSQEEFEARTAKAQGLMAKHGLAALLLTSEPEVRYFTGFLTRFWESPTRPWYLVVPASGKTVAVITSIGAALMGRGWIDDVRTWSSPDLSDDGVSLLADVLNELASGGVVGVPDSHETHVRMPLNDVQRLGERVKLGSDHGIIRQMRMVKSQAEIDKIARACQIAGNAFARVPEIACAGVPIETVFRKFQMLCLDEGADWVPYVSGGAEQGGYSDVISPASDAPLANGDVLMLDTGLVWDGYFSDFDRNWSIGPASDAVRDAHARLIEASDAAFEICRPGKTAADLFHAMNDIVSKDSEDTGAGRLGHGLGMSLTEWPSLIPTDHTVIEEGMVLTLEPGIAIGDVLLVHEENIVVTENGPKYLSPRQASEIPEL